MILLLCLCIAVARYHWHILLSSINHYVLISRTSISVELYPLLLGQAYYNRISPKQSFTVKLIVSFMAEAFSSSLYLSFLPEYLFVWQQTSLRLYHVDQRPSILMHQDNVDILLFFITLIFSGTLFVSNIISFTPSMKYWLL